MKRSLAVVFGLFAISTAAPAFARDARPAPVSTYSHRAQTGKLIVQNQSGIAQRLTIGNVSYGTLRPGASKTIDLTPGRHTVTWTTGGRFASTEREVIRISPREREVLRLTANTASLNVKNPYRFAVQVRIDGKRMGTIAAGGTLKLSGLAPGRVEVELFRGNQKVSDQTMRLARGANTFTPGFNVAFR